MRVLLITFAVRHKPTGHFIPVPGGRMGRGGSHTEPTDPAQSPPRQFVSERAAKIFINTWVKGKVVCHRSGYNGSGYEYDDYCEDNETIPVPHRRAEDMEVVPLKLILEEG